MDIPVFLWYNINCIIVAFCSKIKIYVYIKGMTLVWISTLSEKSSES